MLDYEDQVLRYLQENFTVSNPDVANFKRTTAGLLDFLFLTFPVGCINDFQLNDILMSLGHQRYNYIIESVSERTEGKKDSKRTITTISKTLTSGWCLKSHFSLLPDVFEVSV